MTRSIAFFVAVSCAAVGAVSAHEGHKHGAHTMSGTVTAVHAEGNHVEMKTVKGETTSFFVDSKTKFLKGKAAADLAALTPGTRIVVEVDTVDKRMVARTVRIGAAPKASTRTPAGHQR